MKIIKGGLNPTPKDNRDFIYEKVFGAIKPPDTDFIVAEPLFIEDQKGTDYCGAYAGSSSAEDHEGIDLDPLFSFATIKEVDGNPNGWGSNLRDIMKAGCDYGFLEKKDAIYKVDDPRNKIVYLNNYPPELKDKAKVHRQSSYFKIDGGFNGIRSALWQHKDKKNSIVTGVVWRKGWSNSTNGVISNEETEKYFGHALKIYGQKNVGGELRLMAQLSNGRGIGFGGKFYISKEVADRDFTFGAYMWNDMQKGEAQKKSWSLWQKFVNIIKSLFSWLN